MQSDQCISCKHYTGVRSCQAFPEGIPVEVFTGKHDHRTAYPGDGGIRYEPLVSVAETPAAKGPAKLGIT